MRDDEIYWYNIRDCRTQITSVINCYTPVFQRMGLAVLHTIYDMSPSGAWTSKLGSLEDIQHELAGVEGEMYGTIQQFMKRTIE
jgi:hypothetical protein